MKQTVKIAGGVLVLLLLGACIAGSADSQHAADSGPLAHFLLGLWHGIIAPITLIVEVVGLVAPHVLPWRTHLYETAAAGPLYDLGFYLGLAGSPIVIVNRGWRR